MYVSDLSLPYVESFHCIADSDVLYPVQDVDLLCLVPSSFNRRELKEMCTSYHPSFHLTLPKARGARHRVLQYRINPELNCKIDLIPPGNMNIPRVPTQDVIYRNKFPLMPFYPLLLLKVQGWEDHRLSGKSHMEAKIPQDVEDIFELLALVMLRRSQSQVESGIELNETAWWITEEFKDEGKRRIHDFARKHPESRDSWKALGLL
jgi:hypothetical protein